MDTKMVIVWRKDLKGRTGKAMAQSGHASIVWLVNRLNQGKNGECKGVFSQIELDWMYYGMTKVVLQVENEKELMEVFQQAKASGLETHLIKDAGKTEYDGPTITCIGIGPDVSDKINKVTGHLKPY